MNDERYFRKRALLFGLAILFAGSIVFSQTETKTQNENKDSVREISKGVPVLFHRDTLFLIYERTGSFSPEERAAAISRRIEKLANDFSFSSDSLQVVPAENSRDIVYGETTIVSITPEDAKIKKMAIQRLAIHYQQIIAGSITNYSKSTGIKTILLDIGLILVILIAVYWIIKYVSKFSHYLRSKLIKWEGQYFKGFKIREYELLTARNQLKVILFLNNIIRWIVIILLIYLTLPLVFNILPWTRGLANALFGFIYDPLKNILLGFWHYLPSLFAIIVIVVVFRYILKGVLFLKNEVEREALHIPGFYPDWANPTYQIIRVLIYAFMLVVIFPYLPGSNSPVFQGVSVFLGFLLTFGSSGSLSNVVAGLVLTYMRAFKIGDRVTIGDVTGDIVEKSILVTRIRTIKNEDITIPNSTIMNSHTINFSSSSQNPGLILHTSVTIGYDTPWRQIHQLLIEAAKVTDLLLAEPEPFVLQTSLDDFYVSYQINAYTKTASKQAQIYSQLHQNIQDKFNEAGVEIMSPHYGSIRDGNQTAIPPDYLPKDYIPSTFKVTKTS